MTFVTKEFKFIRDEFKAKISNYLKEMGVDSIEKLPDANRIYQINFIFAVIDELEKCSGKIDKSGTLYGALLLIDADIKESRSDLKSFIEITINKDQKGYPSHQQKADYFSKINSLLSSIYIDNNSLKGINTENAFKIVPITNLTNLYFLSLDKQREHKNAFITSLEVKSKDAFNLAQFKLSTPVPKSQEPKSEWSNLQTTFEQIVTEELKAQGVTHEYEIKNADRKQQIAFLRALKDTLTQDQRHKDLANEKKLAIFKGAMYLVRGMIASLEYKKPTITTDDLRSKLHTELTKALAAKSARPEEIEAYNNAILEYLSALLLDSNGSVLRDKHPFAKISGLNVKNLLTTAHDIDCEALKGALQSCKEKLQKPYQKEKGSSLLSWFSFDKSQSKQQDLSKSTTTHESATLETSVAPK